ncbi:YegP family protein [Pacificispira sp.]|uniref:YegP family protein n=1 Tax=Pacificispira sp. TaxID=2888761 RepID=UPI003B52F046
MGNYVVYKDRNYQWRWRFVSSNGRTISDSAESYHNKQDCLNGIRIMKSSTASPVHEV